MSLSWGLVGDLVGPVSGDPHFHGKNICTYSSTYLLYIHNVIVDMQIFLAWENSLS